MCIDCFGGGPPRHHPGPGGPPGGGGGGGWGPPGGGGGWGPSGGGGHGNPIVNCLCCPCYLLQYIGYAIGEIGYCCGFGNCFGYDRGPPGHHPPPHQHHY